MQWKLIGNNRSCFYFNIDINFMKKDVYIFSIITKIIEEKLGFDNIILILINEIVCFF